MDDIEAKLARAADGIEDLNDTIATVVEPLCPGSGEWWDRYLDAAARMVGPGRSADDIDAAREAWVSYWFYVMPDLPPQLREVFGRTAEIRRASLERQAAEWRA